MDHVYFGGQGGIRDKTEDRFGISMAVLLSVGQVNDLHTGQVNDRYRYCERGTREDIRALIKEKIRGISNNVRELNRYLVVSELLKAIDIFYGGQGNIDFEKAKVYVDKLNQHIDITLDFQEIMGMENLIDII
ncbi:MAG: hypothetical protein HFH80_10020 [Lachnospiraceae bacterium]|nr:hypothetical protein [Lachnospiraceae bacterium]